MNLVNLNVGVLPIYKGELQVPAGKKGYTQHEFKVEHAGLSNHHILIELKVWQGSASNLDIRFLIFDRANYEIWLKMLDAAEEGDDYAKPSALVNVLKIMRGELVFRPPSDGTYYIVLDNRYSRWMSKTVAIKMTEIWYEKPEDTPARLDVE